MFSLLDLSMHGYCRVYIEQKNYKIILIWMFFVKKNN
jgi:hypothetical protein